MRKARLLDASHSVRSHWTTRNFVEVFDDDDHASVSSTPSQASSMLNESMDSTKEQKSSVKLKLDTKATFGTDPDVTQVKLEPVLNKDKYQVDQQTDQSSSSNFQTPAAGRATARHEHAGAETAEAGQEQAETMTPTERVMMMMAEKLTHLTKQFEDLKSEKDKVNNLTS